MKRIEKQKLNFIQNPETLGAVHTHTHTCSFKSVRKNAIFAFINNVYLKDNL